MGTLYLTWIVLLVFVISAYFYSRRDFAAPVFLFSLSFFASVSIVVLNIENWDIAIHGFQNRTAVCIVLAILSFFLGSLIFRTVFSRKMTEGIGSVSKSVLNRSKGAFPYTFFIAISLVMFVLFMRPRLGSLSFSSMLSFQSDLREIYSTEKEYGFFSSQILEIIVALAYFCLFRYFLEKKYLHQKPKKRLLIPVICFLVCALVYTDRNILLRFFIYGLMLFVMSANWRKVTIRNNHKLMIRVGILVAAAALIFWAYGKLKMYTSNFERMLGIYAGSGLYGFNLWLQDFKDVFTKGGYTFSSVLNTLKAFGIGEGSPYRLENWDYTIFYAQNGYAFATNIYSALRVYYEDFGMTGMIIVPAITGFLFEWLYQTAVRKKYGFWWVFYAAHIYHIIYFPILEQFFYRFHLGIVYEIFWLFFFYFLEYGYNGLWRLKKVKWRVSGRRTDIQETIKDYLS